MIEETLSTREEELDNTLDTPEYDQIEDMIDELENRLGLYTLFAAEFDLDRKEKHDPTSCCPRWHMPC